MIIIICSTFEINPSNMDEESTIKESLNKHVSSFEVLNNIENVSKEQIITTIERLKSELNNEYFEIDIETTRTWNLISFLYFIIGEKSKAVQFNKLVTDKDSENIVARTNSAWYYYKDKDFYECNAILQKLEVDKPNKLDVIKAKAEIAYTYSRLGFHFYRNAVSMFKSILQECIGISAVPTEYICVWKFGLALTIRRQFNLTNWYVSADFDIEKQNVKEIFLLFYDISLLNSKTLRSFKAKAYVEMGLLVDTIEMNKVLISLKESNITSENTADLKLQSSEHYIRLACETCPDDVYVLERSGKYYRYKKKIDLSIELLRKALSLRETSFGHHHLALSLKRKAEMSKRTNIRPTSGKMIEKGKQLDMKKKENPINTTEMGLETTAVQTKLDLTENRKWRLKSGLTRNTNSEYGLIDIEDKAKSESTGSSLKLLSETKVEITGIPFAGSAIKHNPTANSNANVKVKMNPNASVFIPEEKINTGIASLTLDNSVQKPTVKQHTENANITPRITGQKTQQYNPELATSSMSCSIQERERQMTQKGHQDSKPTIRFNVKPIYCLPTHNPWKQTDKERINRAEDHQTRNKIGYSHIREKTITRQTCENVIYNRTKRKYSYRRENTPVEIKQDGLKPPHKSSILRMLKSPRNIQILHDKSYNEEIFEHLEKSLKIQPLNNTALYDKGLMLRCTKQPQAALHVFKQLMSVNGSLMVLSNSYEQAAFCLGDISISTPEQSSTENDKIEYNVKHYLNKSIELSCNIVSRLPSLQDCWFSVPTLKSLLLRQTKTKHTLKELSRLNERIGDFREAISLYKQVVELENDESKKAEVLMTIVKNYVKDNNFEEAIHTFDFIKCLPNGLDKIEPDCFCSVHIVGGLNSLKKDEKDISRLRLRNALSLGKSLNQASGNSDANSGSDKGLCDDVMDGEVFDIFILCDEDVEEKGQKVKSDLELTGLKVTINSDAVISGCNLMFGTVSVMRRSRHFVVVLNGENEKTQITPFIEKFYMLLIDIHDEHTQKNIVVVVDDPTTKVSPVMAMHPRIAFSNNDTLNPEHILWLNDLLLMLATGKHSEVAHIGQCRA